MCTPKAKKIIASRDRTIVMWLSIDRKKLSPFWPRPRPVSDRRRRRGLSPRYQTTLVAALSVHLSPGAMVDVTVIAALYLLRKVQRRRRAKRRRVWLHNILRRRTQLDEDCFQRYLSYELVLHARHDGYVFFAHHQVVNTDWLSRGNYVTEVEYFQLV